MNKVFSGLKKIQIKQILTAFVLGILLLVTQACSSVSAKAPDSNYEGGMNQYSDVDPRSKDAEAAAAIKAKALKDNAEFNIKKNSDTLIDKEAVNLENLNNNLKETTQNMADKVQTSTKEFAEGTKRGIENIKENTSDTFGSLSDNLSDVAEDARLSAQRAAKDANLSTKRAAKDASLSTKRAVEDAGSAVERTLRDVVN